jgi:ankyrin repeat protein
MVSFGLGDTSAVAALAAQTVVDSSTPWMAASEGNLPLLRLSLDKLGLAAAAQDESGYALIHAAASYNQISILEWLLSQGANAHVVDEEGDGSLHYSGTAETAKFLVTQGHVDPNVANVEGKTALQAKQEELDEMMQEEDIEDDDDDLEALKALVEYLRSL